MSSATATSRTGKYSPPSGRRAFASNSKNTSRAMPASNVRSGLVALHSQWSSYCTVCSTSVGA
jgi:hypothetical protein